MATQKQIKFFNELKRQGRPSRTQEIDSFSIPEAWKIIAEMLGKEGNGEIEMDENYNNEIINSTNEAEKNNYGKKQTRNDNANENDTNAGFDIEWINDNAEDNGIEAFTKEHKEAMWVTPSGRLINGDFQSGYRNLDHRNALKQDDFEGITKAADKGAIRVMNEYDTIQTKDGTLNNLSPEAKKQAEYYINELGYELEKVE